MSIPLFGVLSCFLLRPGSETFESEISPVHLQVWPSLLFIPDAVRQFLSLSPNHPEPSADVQKTARLALCLQLATNLLSLLLKLMLWWAFCMFWGSIPNRVQAYKRSCSPLWRHEGTTLHLLKNRANKVSKKCFNFLLYVESYSWAGDTLPDNISQVNSE